MTNEQTVTDEEAWLDEAERDMAVGEAELALDDAEAAFEQAQVDRFDGQSTWTSSTRPHRRFAVSMFVLAGTRRQDFWKGACCQPTAFDAALLVARQQGVLKGPQALPNMPGLHKGESAWHVKDNVYIGVQALAPDATDITPGDPAGKARAMAAALRRDADKGVGDHELIDVENTLRVAANALNDAADALDLLSTFGEVATD